jgi:hypothetical protein
MRLKGESYGIDVGTFVMNFHHKLLRFGVVREKRTGDHGWAYCKIDWFEDDIHIAKVAWDKKMGARKAPSEETRVDWLTPVSTQWLENVLNACGEYQNERRTENG